FTLLQLSEAHRLTRTQQAVPIGVEQEDVPQIGTAWPYGFEDGSIDCVPKTAAVQEDTDPRLSQDIFQLVDLVGGIDIDEDGADAGRGILDDDPFVTVG